MATPPWLLTSGPWQNINEIGRRSLHRLGETAAFLQTPGAIDLLSGAILEHSQKEGGKVWGAALAREILLCCSVRPDLLTPISQAVNPSASFLLPFAGGPSLEAILERPVSAAASLIPLQAQAGRSAVFGQIWIVRSPIIVSSRAPEITRKRLVEGDFLKGTGIETLIVVTEEDAPERIEGSSWELGASLASKACHGLEAGDSKTAMALARDWIVTGSVDHESEDVLQVGMRGKLLLAESAPSRDWLLPAANQATIPPEFESKTAGRLHYSIDITSAWSQITGDGFAGGADIFWDEKPLFGVEEFHCLVSNAQGPMLAGFLWSQPKKIVLWTSDFMAGKAEQLKAACDALRETHLTSLLEDDPVEIRSLDDTDLQEIRKAVLGHTSLGRGGTVPVAFNMTGGNLLMRLAIMDLARLRPHIHLVYRPEGRKNLEFVSIGHPFLQPITAKLGHRNLPSQFHQEWLDLINLDLHKVDPESWAKALIKGAPVLENEPAAAMENYHTLQPA